MIETIIDSSGGRGKRKNGCNVEVCHPGGSRDKSKLRVMEVRSVRILGYLSFYVGSSVPTANPPPAQEVLSIAIANYYLQMNLLGGTKTRLPLFAYRRYEWLKVSPQFQSKR